MTLKHSKSFGGHHSALSPDDKYLYVANQYGDSISVIDLQSKKKIKDLPTGKGTDYITPSMYWDGKELWTFNHGMDSKRYPYMLGGEVVSGVQFWRCLSNFDFLHFFLIHDIHATHVYVNRMARSCMMEKNSRLRRADLISVFGAGILGAGLGLLLFEAKPEFL